MTSPTERMTEWLRDAHATELQAGAMLKGTAARLEHYPTLRARLEDQARVAERHVEQLEFCLEQAGETPSKLKDMAAQVTGIGQTLTGKIVGDEVMKAALATSTMAQMEASSYRILIATADMAGQPEVKRVCEDMLEDEEEFLVWMEEQLPVLTVQYLARENSAQTAKH